MSPGTQPAVKGSYVTLFVGTVVAIAQFICKGGSGISPRGLTGLEERPLKSNNPQTCIVSDPKES